MGPPWDEDQTVSLLFPRKAHRQGARKQKGSAGEPAKPRLRSKYLAALRTVRPGGKIVLLLLAQTVDANPHRAQLEFRDPVFHIGRHVVNLGRKLTLIFYRPLGSKRLGGKAHVHDRCRM